MAEILLIEDDLEINNMLVEALTLNGFEVTAAYSGTEGQLLIKQQEFDLILLDLMLPGLTGEDLLKEIRLRSQTPVLIISAKEQIDEKVELLQSGADDYLVKPFNLKELIARIQILLKRSGGRSEKINVSIYDYHGLVYNSQTKALTYQDQELQLTPQERLILSLLLQQPEKIFTKLEIYEHAWGGTYLAEDKTLTVHMSNLRKKLDQATGKTWIETIWGIGFRLNEKI